MKITYCLICILLLSSCVYYGVQRNVDLENNGMKSACDSGSKKEIEKCRANSRKLNEAIEAHKNNNSYMKRL